MMNNLLPPPHLRSFSYQVQPKPLKTVRAGKNTNIPLTFGYQGPDAIDNSYYFNIEMFGSANLRVNDKILLYAQTNSLENGVWDVVSIVSDYVNIRRPIDFKINSGDMILLPSNSSLLSRILVLENRLAELEKKINV